jgi:hypothetical protein
MSIKTTAPVQRGSAKGRKSFDTLDSIGRLVTEGSIVEIIRYKVHVMNLPCLHIAEIC